MTNDDASTRDVPVATSNMIARTRARVLLLQGTPGNRAVRRTQARNAARLCGRTGHLFHTGQDHCARAGCNAPRPT